MFALKNIKTGKLMGVTSSSNGDAEFASSTEFSLCEYAHNVWVVTSRSVAEKAAVTDTPWYNADYDTPGNDYVGKLEVVELAIKE